MVVNTRRRQAIVGCLLLSVLTVAAFWQVLQNGFINLDDGDYITKNPHVITGLTWDNVGWAFTTTRASNWNPLTWISHMVDVQLFGLNPCGHHLVNLLIHTANTCLLFVVLSGLTRAALRSFFVAALFAVHPLHVESVAWASERKDVLSTFFLFLTLWAYARYAAQPHLISSWFVLKRKTGTEPSTPAPPPHSQARLFYCLALAMFILGLLCKPMLVTLPIALLLIDAWPLGRLDLQTKSVLPPGFGGLLIEKIPFFVMAGGSGLITVLSQSRNYSLLGGLPFAIRLATALSNYLKYVGKTVWPSGLGICYPDPNARYFAPHATPFYPVSELWPAWQLGCAGLFLTAVSLLVFLRRQKQPWAFTGWFWYLVFLLPVIGLVQAGVQVMADHYTYIALIGIFILVVWGASELTGNARSARAALAITCTLTVAACCWLTSKQVAYWRNDQALFGHAFAVTARNPMAEWMVGAGLAQQGRVGLAQTHFRLALAADPFFVDARSALGSLFELENKPELAINEYQNALKYKQQDEFSRVHLAGVFRKLGRNDEALREYQKAVRYNPDSVEANYEAGALLLDTGKLDQAGAYLETALRLSPKHQDALLCLSDLRSQQGRFTEALAPLKTLVQLHPGVFELRLNLGGLLWKAGQLPDAIKEYREVSRMNPTQPAAHYDLGAALMASGDSREAMREFGEALRLNPDSFDAAVGLGRAAAASSDYHRAQSALAQAAQIAPTNAWVLAQLAVASLMSGDTNHALSIRASALTLQPGLVAQGIAEAQSLFNRGEFNAALVSFNTVFYLDPNSSACLSNLAWLLATHPQAEMRNGPRALALARHAIEVAPTDPSAWAALDAAFAETGNFQEALRSAGKARALALAAADTEGARAAEFRMTYYGRGKAYHIR
jgi:protein O-mannosyl-transferase